MREIVAEQCCLLDVTTYFVRALTRAGVVCKYMGSGEPDSDDARQSLIEITCAKTRALWIRFYRAGPFSGKVEVASYSEPFVFADLERVGPAIVARVLEDC